MTGIGRNPMLLGIKRNFTPCYECGSLRHFKSKCPIVKFQKYVNKKISTLSECQDENKRKLNNLPRIIRTNKHVRREAKILAKLSMQGHGERNITAGPSVVVLKGDLQMTILLTTKEKVNCYECGNQGHYRRDCPERKNQSHKNQIGGTGAHGVVHTLRGGETDQDPNNIKDEIKA
ncbi:reverse transcriptase domain-containing protein [Tanacetum coccineum]